MMKEQQKKPKNQFSSVTVSQDALVRIGILQSKIQQSKQSKIQWSAAQQQIANIKWWNLLDCKHYMFIRRVVGFCETLSKHQQLLVQSLQQFASLLGHTAHQRYRITLRYLIIKNYQYITKQQLQSQCAYIINTMVSTCSSNRLLRYGQIAIQCNLIFCKLVSNLQQFQIVMGRNIGQLEEIMYRILPQRLATDIQPTSEPKLAHNQFGQKDKFVNILAQAQLYAKSLIRFYNLAIYKYIDNQQIQNYKIRKENLKKFLEQYSICFKQEDKKILIKQRKQIQIQLNKVIASPNRQKSGKVQHKITNRYWYLGIEARRIESQKSVKSSLLMTSDKIQKILNLSRNKHVENRKSGQKDKDQEHSQNQAYNNTKNVVIKRDLLQLKQQALCNLTKGVKVKKIKQNTSQMNNPYSFHINLKQMDKYKQNKIERNKFLNKNAKADNDQQKYSNFNVNNSKLKCHTMHFQNYNSRNEISKQYQFNLSPSLNYKKNPNVKQQCRQKLYRDSKSQDTNKLQIFRKKSRTKLNKNLRTYMSHAGKDKVQQLINLKLQALEGVLQIDKVIVNQASIQYQKQKQQQKKQIRNQMLDINSYRDSDVMQIHIRSIKSSVNSLNTSNNLTDVLSNQSAYLVNVHAAQSEMHLSCASFSSCQSDAIQNCPQKSQQKFNLEEVGLLSQDMESQQNLQYTGMMMITDQCNEDSREQQVQIQVINEYLNAIESTLIRRMIYVQDIQQQAGVQIKCMPQQQQGDISISSNQDYSNNRIVKSNLNRQNKNRWENQYSSQYLQDQQQIQNQYKSIIQPPSQKQLQSIVKQQIQITLFACFQQIQERKLIQKQEDTFKLIQIDIDSTSFKIQYKQDSNNGQITGHLQESCIFLRIPYTLLQTKSQALSLINNEQNYLIINQQSSEKQNKTSQNSQKDKGEHNQSIFQLINGRLSFIVYGLWCQIGKYPLSVRIHQGNNNIQALLSFQYVLYQAFHHDSFDSYILLKLQQFQLKENIERPNCLITHMKIPNLQLKLYKDLMLNLDTLIAANLQITITATKNQDKDINQRKWHIEVREQSIRFEELIMIIS